MLIQSCCIFLKIQHCPPLSSPPHANSFVIGPAVINNNNIRIIMIIPVRVCVYYCSTYYKAVRLGGGGFVGIVEDMCYERRPAEARVD